MQQHHKFIFMYREYQQSRSAYSTSSTVKTLIIINVAIFILTYFLRNIELNRILGLVPNQVFSQLKIWQLVTYMFMHGYFLHLAFNMLMLWFFGPAIERAWGRKEFLRFYFSAGIMAGFCSFIVNPSSQVAIIGASGAVIALLIAYAIMFPETIVLVLLFFPMKIRHAAIFFVAADLWGAMGNPGSGIAYFAHLGGALFGYVYLKNEWIRGKLAYLSITNLKGRSKDMNIQKTSREKADINTRVDEILDKISKHGMDSLTPEEKTVLDKKSQMK